MLCTCTQCVCPSREQQVIIIMYTCLCTCMHQPSMYLLSYNQDSPPTLKLVLKEGSSDSPDPGPAKLQHLETCPCPSSPIRGRRALRPRAAPGASKEAQGELTPWPSRWSSGWGRKSHRHPWHSREPE